MSFQIKGHMQDGKVSFPASECKVSMGHTNQIKLIQSHPRDKCDGIVAVPFIDQLSACVRV